jgi:hypothetical protein
MSKDYRRGTDYGFDRDVELESAALAFMTPEQIKTTTPKQLRNLVKQYNDKMSMSTHHYNQDNSNSNSNYDTQTLGTSPPSVSSSLTLDDPSMDFWGDFSTQSTQSTPPTSPKPITLPAVKKIAPTTRPSPPPQALISPIARPSLAPMPMPTLSLSASTGGSTYIPEKIRALQLVIDELDKQFGDCNDKVKKHIHQINILYTPTHQKILSSFFSPEERENIYTLVRPTHMEMYQQLYKLLLESHQQRNMLMTAMFQNNPALKNLYEYMESRQQNLSDLLKKYKTILESTGEDE